MSGLLCCSGCDIDGDSPMIPTQQSNKTKKDQDVATNAMLLRFQIQVAGSGTVLIPNICISSNSNVVDLKKKIDESLQPTSKKKIHYFLYLDNSLLQDDDESLTLILQKSVESTSKTKSKTKTNTNTMVQKHNFITLQLVRIVWTFLDDEKQVNGLPHLSKFTQANDTIIKRTIRVCFLRAALVISVFQAWNTYHNFCEYDEQDNCYMSIGIGCIPNLFAKHNYSLTNMCQWTQKEYWCSFRPDKASGKLSSPFINWNPDIIKGHGGEMNQPFDIATPNLISLFRKIAEIAYIKPFCFRIFELSSQLREFKSPFVGVKFPSEFIYCMYFLIYNNHHLQIMWSKAWTNAQEIICNKINLADYFNTQKDTK